MNKTTAFVLYASSVIYYEQDELNRRVDEAFSREFVAETGFDIVDIFLFIMLYPYHLLTSLVINKNMDIGMMMIEIYNFFIQVLLSPIFVILITWYKIESNLKGKR